MNERAISGGTEFLNILVVAFLPFYCDGKVTFHNGGSVFYTELLPGLAKLGHTVRVIAQAPAAQKGQKRTGLKWKIPRLTVEWFALEYRFGAIPSPSFLAREKRDLRPVFNRMVKEQRPDIVIIGRQALVWNVLELCREYRLPSLLLPHGAPLSAFSPDTYPQAVQQDLADRFRQVDMVVVVAKHLETLIRSLGVSNVCTIPNIADPARFCPKPKDPQLLKDLHLTAHQPVVSHLSVLKPAKRPLDIIASAELVLRSRPDVVYVIVGDGPCRGEMEELGRKKGLASSFRYAGEIAHQQVPQYLNLADIVVLPSEREGFPLVYREAQACGRVLIVSDIPAAQEAIVDGETGRLFRLGDVQDLAAKTLAVVQDSALRHRIGEKARTVAMAEDPLQWAQSYARVLSRAAANEKSSW